MQTLKTMILRQLETHYDLYEENVGDLVDRAVEDHDEAFLLASTEERVAMAEDCALSIADHVADEANTGSWDYFMAEFSEEVHNLEETGNIKAFLEWATLYIDVQEEQQE